MSESLKQGGPGESFEVGEILVEPGLNRIVRGGEVVALEPRVMELLVCLARRPNETLSKEQLLAEVWGGAFVVDGVVAKTVSALRQALGDDAGEPRYVLTVPRRGYRWMAPVRRPDVPGPEPPPLAAPARPSLPEPPRKRVLSWPLAATLGGLVLIAGLWWGLRGVVGADSGDAEPVAAEPLPPELERQLLRARMLWSRRGRPDLQTAHELFSRVVAAAPSSGEARAWLALSLITRSNYLQTARRETLLEAEVEAGRALALDPEHPVTLTALGAVAFNRRLDLEQATRAYRQAIERAPDFALPRQYLAEALCAQGKLAEAREQIDRAVALEPTTALLHGVDALIAMAERNPHDALAATDRALALEPRFTWLYRYRGQAWWLLGEPQQAAEAFINEWHGIDPANPYRQAALAALAGGGPQAAFRDRVELLLARRLRGEPALHIHFAEAYAALGETENALAELESGALADEAEYFIHARPSPLFDALRDHPRFRAAYARYGL